MGPRHRWDQLTLEPRTGEVQSEWINERLSRLDRLRGVSDSPAPKVRMTAPSYPPAAHHALFGDVFPALSGQALGGRAERACWRRIVRHPARLVLAGLDPRAANITSTVAL